MVAAEAMACGVPVVASRIAAIPEVVLDGETGLLAEPGDPVDLASKLRILLQDPGQRRRLGIAGKLRDDPEAILADDLLDIVQTAFEIVAPD